MIFVMFICNITEKVLHVIKVSFWDEKEAKKLFQKLPFYNIFIEKPKVKGFKDMNLLQELPFYTELNIYEMSKSFAWYERNYKVEIADSKDPLAQLEASKSSIKVLFEDVLDEDKSFKYQITVKFCWEKTSQMEI